MIKIFEGSSHFLTYAYESAESFSANCNVLIALTLSQTPSLYAAQILKALSFLCETWDKGEIKDKWVCNSVSVLTQDVSLTDRQNLEPQYSMMLMARALCGVLKLWGADQLPELTASQVFYNIPRITLQICTRSLSSQSSQGCWKDSAEVSAYAILTLRCLASLPWITQSFGDDLERGIKLGVEFLKSHPQSGRSAEIIWIEKVTYGSPLLSETYCLSALQHCAQQTWGEKIIDLVELSEKQLETFSGFFAQLPLFTMEPKWRLRASTAEGMMFSGSLLSSPAALVFADDRVTRSHKYLHYIPITWTVCNNVTAFGISTRTMLEMMAISMLNFQVDHYLEQIAIQRNSRADLRALLEMTKEIFDELTQLPPHNSTDAGNQKDAYSNCIEASPTNTRSILVDFDNTIRRFTSYVLAHPAITCSPDHIQRKVKLELSIFLQAHLVHEQDNLTFRSDNKASKEAQVFSSARNSFHRWVRTTSADHTSCPYSFEFFRCLITPAGKDCFAGCLQSYLAQDVCNHLASMCRIYNDYGSILRDRAEQNLNSSNFPEFHQYEGDSEHGHQSARLVPPSDDTLRQRLMTVAQYERECLDIALKKLMNGVSSTTWRALQVFVKVTDLYGQIYMVKDINESPKSK
ncbi:hypothetical protein F5Y12DRAFT_757041 [Xylaria sp. FL1777]|nr:hypothetical protein F5Y12DRAFT_757041 [Xylaria sp. FL1777]